MHKLVIMGKLFIQGNQQYFLHGQKNIYYSLSSSLAWVLSVKHLLPSHPGSDLRTFL